MSNQLPTAQQESAMAQSFASRPGVNNGAPAGVSGATRSEEKAAPFVPSGSSATSNSSKTPAAGHVPGEFPDTKEQDAALLQPIPSRPGVSSGQARQDVPVDTGANLPSDVGTPASGSAQQPSTAGLDLQKGLHQAEEQAYNAAQAVLGTVKNGLGYLKDTVASHQQAQENKQIHRDGTDYIEEQLDEKQTDTKKHTLLPVADASTSLPTTQQDADLVFTKDTRPRADTNAPPLGLQGALRKVDMNTGVPVNTVESTSEPDFSDEHRPKTLPRSEIEACEQARGVRESNDAIPARVQVSRRHGASSQGPTPRGEALNDKSAMERELLSKVTPALTASGFTPRTGAAEGSTAAPRIGAPVEEVGNWGNETSRVLGTAGATIGLSAVNAARQHAVTSAGSQQEYPPGQDPSYPHVGTSQIGQTHQPGQSDSIPPVLFSSAGPEPGKGVAPLQGYELEAAQRDVFGTARPHERLGIAARASVETPPKDSIIVKDLGPSQLPSDRRVEEEPHKKSMADDLPIRPAEQSAARAGSVNPVETNAGEGLSAPPIMSDDSIDNASTQTSGAKSEEHGGNGTPTTNTTQPESSKSGETFDDRAHAAPATTEPKDPGWSGKERVKEHLRNDTKARVRENPEAIPVAGGKRVGEEHWGESKKLN